MLRMVSWYGFSWLTVEIMFATAKWSQSLVWCACSIVFLTAFGLEELLYLFFLCLKVCKVSRASHQKWVLVVALGPGHTFIQELWVMSHCTWAPVFHFMIPGRLNDMACERHVNFELWVWPSKRGKRISIMCLYWSHVISGEGSLLKCSFESKGFWVCIWNSVDSSWGRM